MMYLAGAGTTVSAQYAFYLAMLLYPGACGHPTQTWLIIEVLVRCTEKGAGRN